MILILINKINNNKKKIDWRGKIKKKNQQKAEIEEIPTNNYPNNICKIIDESFTQQDEELLNDLLGENLEIKQSEIHGKGLFAISKIKKGKNFN